MSSAVSVYLESTPSDHDTGEENNESALDCGELSKFIPKNISDFQGVVKFTHLNRKSSFRLYSHGISGDTPSASRRSGSPSKCSRSIAAFGAL